jgi:hypothetical protein
MKQLLFISSLFLALQVNAQENPFFKKIILQPEISYIAVNFTAPIVTDNPNDKTIIAKFNLISEDGQKWDYPNTILWQDSAYDSIGIWTDIDVRNRVIQIINLK